MTRFVRLLAAGLAALLLAGAAEAARVPPGVTSIRIRSATGFTTTATCPGCVQEIVKAFDALPKFVARPCPYPVYTPPDVTFDFRTASGAVVLHAVDHAPGTCSGSIAYSTDGQVKYAPLADDGFVARVSELMGGDVDPSARTAANWRLAGRDVRRLLDFAVLPPGSRRVTMPAQLSMTPSEVGAGRTWKVRMSAKAVQAFERAHRPRGSKWAESDTAYAHGKVSEARVGFSFPSVRNRLWSRDLTFSIVPLANGWTRVGVGADDTWVVARTPDELVRGGVRTVEIRKGSLVAHRVTAPRKVATITRWFNALPLAPSGSCKGPTGAPGMRPGQRPAFERITFLDGSGQVLAHARAYPYGFVLGECSPIDFWAGGRSLPALFGGRFLIRVERLLR